MVKSFAAFGESCTDRQRGWAQSRLDAKCGLYFCDERHSLGEVTIVPNGTYAYDQCGWMTQADKLLRPGDGNKVFDIVVLVSSPEGGFFQHFIDGALPKLAMLQLIGDSGIFDLVQSSKERNETLAFVLNSAPHWSYLRDVLELFGLPKDVRIELGTKTARLTGRKMINLCLAPPLSPTLWQSMRSTLVANLPIPRRDLIVYTSRSDGAAGNGGRRVLNEESLLTRLRALANTTVGTAAPMVVDVFKSRQFKTLDATLFYFQRALIIVGPHGGALTNVCFMQKQSHVIEFFPLNPLTKDAVFMHGCNMFWLMSSMLELQYHQVVTTDVVQQTWDMRVDEDAVINIVSKILEANR